MQHQRPYDFATGTTIVADQIDQEFNTIQGVLNGNIDTDNLKDVSVTEEKIASNAVTTAKIKDASVTMPKISNPYKFKVYRNGDQSVTTGTWTAVQLNAEEFDTNSNFDTTTYKYTVPVTGYYFLNGAIYLPAADGIYTIVCLYKNNVSTAVDGTRLSEARDSSPNATSLNKYISTTYFGLLTAGDRVSMTAYLDDTTSPIVGGGSSGTTLSGFLVSV
jgi:hypothetical protein